MVIEMPLNMEPQKCLTPAVGKRIILNFIASGNARKPLKPMFTLILSTKCLKINFLCFLPVLVKIASARPKDKAYKSIFSNFSTKIYVVGTQKNRLSVTVLLSGQNICFNLWIR